MQLRAIIITPIAIETAAAETAAEAQTTAICHKPKILIVGLEIRQSSILLQKICLLLNSNACVLDVVCTAIEHKIAIQTGR